MQGGPAVDAGPVPASVDRAGDGGCLLAGRSLPGLGATLNAVQVDASG
ncbi:MAG TPA: hypothetical protein VHH53_01820 [Pseudonocardiaceae bacterium]|nr:hypothetical protein [Pseudonocardiaceae bacterium]